MADEFQWWNTSRSLFGSASSSLGSSASAIDIGFHGWPSTEHLVDLKTTTRSSAADESAAATVSDGSVVLQELPPPQLQHHHHPPNSGNGGTAVAGSISMASPLHMNQALLQNNGTSESNYSSILQQDLNYTSVSDDSPTNDNTLKPLMNQTFAFDHHHQLYSSSSSSSSSSPLSLSSYSYPSNFQQSLYGTTLYHHHHHQPNMNFLSNINYPTSMLKASSFLGQELLPTTVGTHHHHQLPLPDNSSSRPWKASAEVNNDKINLKKFTAKKANNGEQVSRKAKDEPAPKRPRTETPSPLPTFKVRKEKLGDRITALQQLVSPFGKTDTASVLHEVIEYIKFLHDQVGVLSTPYMKNGPSQVNIHSQQIVDKLKDLKSRGLCLVPITSTFPVATETPTDFWTPTTTIGGGFNNNNNHRQNGEALQHLRKQLISY